jgi:hypothetical protein
VNAVAEPSTRPLTRLETLLGRVRAHPWVAAVACRSEPARTRVARTLLVVPSEAGITALHRAGKAHLVATWQALGDSAMPALAWRLVETLETVRTDADIRDSRPIVLAIAPAGGAALEASLRVPYELRVFEGHFAGVPLVPGVTQLAWVLGLARDHLGTTGLCSGITAAKFRRLVRPGMELRLLLQWRAEAGELRFEFTGDGDTVSLGRLRMGVDRA